jgi:hypothetical protein
MRKLCLGLFLVFTFLPRAAQAIDDPTDISGLSLWLDASDAASLFTDAGCSSAVSADGDQVVCWHDKSGTNHDALVFSMESGALYHNSVGEMINGNSVLKFNRGVSVTDGSVYQVAGLDLRSGTTEDVTIVTVFRPRSAVNQQALWGIDNGGFDRFAYSYLAAFGDGVDDGVVGLGPDLQVQVIPDAGQQNVVR